MTGLTASQEDYLEAIYNLIRDTGAARVTDIAARLKVTNSSVTVALRALAKLELVHYEPYQLVKLTPPGLAQAERVHRRHRALREFLARVLSLNEASADANACRMEHAVGDAVMHRLSCFVEFLTQSSVPARELPEAFRRSCAERRHSGECEGCGLADSVLCEAATSEADAAPTAIPGGAREVLSLADLKPGEKGRVRRVDGSPRVRQRLQEMGVTRNVSVTVLRVAPLGDPVQIQVRWGHLSLRKAEARGIELERME